MNVCFFCSLREWRCVMVQADDDNSEQGYLKYYLHGNEHPIKCPNETEGELCVWFLHLFAGRWRVVWNSDWKINRRPIEWIFQKIYKKV